LFPFCLLFSAVFCSKHEKQVFGSFHSDGWKVNIFDATPCSFVEMNSTFYGDCMQLSHLGLSTGGMWSQYPREAWGNRAQHQGRAWNNHHASGQKTGYMDRFVKVALRTS
jgi:hypothetical protein